jgi:TPR repeat protein
MSYDYERAQIEALAEQGDVTSQIYLGWAHDRFGVYEYDVTKAERWLRLAAGTGAIEGLRRLVRLQLQHGQPQAHDTALLLADRKDFYGHYMLGHIYLHGYCGIAINKIRGVDNLAISSHLGHLPSKIDYLRNSGKYALLNPVIILGLIATCAQFVWVYTTDRSNLRVYM